MTRTAELTTKLLDGTLSDAECDELEALVTTDPGAAAEHLALLELEAELRGLRSDFDLTDATLARVRDAQAERTAGAVLTEIASRTPPSWAKTATPAETEPHPHAQPSARRGLRARAVTIAALATAAACIVALVGMWIGGKQQEAVTPQTGVEPSVAFAKLATKNGSVEVLNSAGDAIPAEEGVELPPGFLLRTVGDDSLAVIELLSDRTRVEIEPDSVVRFAGTSPDGRSKPRVFLAQGQLTAAVAVRDGALVVGTPVADVSTRGGTFVVSSAGPESARVDVKQGKVELVRAAAPKPVPVSGGAVVVRAGSDKVDIERWVTDRVPKRVLAAPGTRDAIFSPGGAEVWVATARAFGQWTSDGGLKEIGFLSPRKGNEGVAQFTRDKRFLITFRGERDDSVLVRTLPDGGEHAAINARLTDPRSWTVAPEASWLATVDPKPNNKLVRVLDGRAGNERFTCDFDDPVTCLAASPDARSLAVAVYATARGASPKVALLDANTGERLFALPLQLKRPPTALSFSADGRVLAIGFNGTVQLWDVRIRDLARSITGFERPVTCLAFAPDGKRIAAGTPDGHVWVWDVATGRQTQLIETGGRMVRSIAFSPSGKQLVTVANNSPVALWDVTDPLPAPGEIQ
jgi:ferric-dicitrate binding protein FerR (iron transport regulator)